MNPLRYTAVGGSETCIEVSFLTKVLYLHQPSGLCPVCEVSWREIMSKHIRRVQYQLDSKNIKHLSSDEVKKILRAADPLIMSGGRTLLAKVLKGSKEKKVLELKLNENPAYGYFKDLSIEEITARIDWTIQRNFLAIEYDHRLPLLVYTSMGWEIEKDTYTDDLLRGFDKMLESGQDKYDMTYLKDRNRQMIHMLLDKVQATQNPKYIPILEAWAEIDYKKVKSHIRAVINNLKQKSQ
jgi:superfamily II DNA helicase RecQ